MKHEFTDQQLDHAMGVSQEVTGDDYILEVSLEGISAFLDALPESGNPHPEIEFDEVRKGDRIDVLTIYGNHEILTVEARTDFHLLAMGTQIPAENYAESIRLIDRPVAHPDPAVHPVIYVKECNVVNFIPKIMVWYRDSYVAGRQCLSSEQITDWQQIDPAQVVADNDC